jgi:hypothetical protein
LTSEFAGHDWYISAFWTLSIECHYYFLIALSFPLFVSRFRSLQVTVLTAWIVTPLFFSYGATTTVFPWTSLFAMGITA